MLDQARTSSPDAAKPPLRGCRRLEGDAEALPLETDSFDRYVSAGSIEYRPEPQRAVAEAYRVLRLRRSRRVVGPLPPANRVFELVVEAVDAVRAATTAPGWPPPASPTSSPPMSRPAGIAIAARLWPGDRRDEAVARAVAASTAGAPRAARRTDDARTPPALRRPLSRRVGSGSGVRPDRSRARAAREAREEVVSTAGTRGTALASRARAIGARRGLWRFSPPHDRGHHGQRDRPLCDRGGRRSCERRARSRRDAARRLV